MQTPTSPDRRADDPVGPAGDVGRWFSTAADPGASRLAEQRGGTGRESARGGSGTSTAHDASSPGPSASTSTLPRRGLPRMPAWGRVEGGEYGLVSPPEVVDRALEVLRGGPVAVLTGAGMSTDSGLPDYRGAHAVPRAPMTIQEFIGSDLSRRRYWARSTVGWPQFLRAAPNRGHALLAALHPAVLDITGVITQNVDGLHQRAGSHPVVDLHGRLDTVRCLSCDTTIDRSRFHDRLLGLNPQVAARLPELVADAAQAPDGDAEVDRTADFRYPPCAVCGGILKPDVVFFGEAARRESVQAAYDLVERSRALLVLGSSLTVQSGLRFVRATQKQGAPVVIVNDGPTRADARASVRVHGRIDQVLGAWAGG